MATTDSLTPTLIPPTPALHLVPKPKRGPYNKANKRKRAAHPGVTVVQRGERFGLVYRDRSLGDTKARERRLPRDIDSAASAHAEAMLVYKRLERWKRDRIALGETMDAAASPLAALVAEYITDLRDVRDRSPRTAAKRLVTLNELIVWCHAKGVTTIEALTAKALGEWNTYATTRPSTRARDQGRKRSAATVDQDRKYLHAFLGWCRRSKRVAKHLDDDVLSETIPLVATKGRKAKQSIRVLTVRELRATLSAALQHDRFVPYAEAVAPDVAMLLLTALRREEWALTRVRDLCLDVASPFDTSEDAATIDYLNVLHGKGTAEARKCFFTAFTVLGLELAREMAEGRAGDEWLSPHTYHTIGQALAQLAIHGAPKFSPKDLRSTCCSYETRLEIAGNTAALNARQGHTDRVRLDSYTDSLVGLSAPKRYATLEDAMGVAGEVRAIIDALRARKATYGVKPQRGDREKRMPQQKGVVGLAL